ncbi:MAG: rRNA adenine N-6-methyltransferase family protein, partial [Eikenella corrodens]|nr:rRNA adenine N-6-methyltransferase family protein [Eikenella corrodens]
EAFSPAPKVDSAVVRLIPTKYRIGQAQDFEQFAALVKQAFHQRRKTIRNNLKGLADDNDLQAAGISPQERAEHIAPEKYVALANLLAHKAS